MVTGSPYRIDTTDFATKVRKFNKRDPFNFTDPFSALGKFSIYISIYAAHLYDSVMLYAKALDTMINQRKDNEELVNTGIGNVW